MLVRQIPFLKFYPNNAELGAYDFIMVSINLALCYCQSVLMWCRWDEWKTNATWSLIPATRGVGVGLPLNTWVLDSPTYSYLTSCRSTGGQLLRRWITGVGLWRVGSFVLIAHAGFCLYLDGTTWLFGPFFGFWFSGVAYWDLVFVFWVSGFSFCYFLHVVRLNWISTLPIT